MDDDHADAQAAASAETTLLLTNLEIALRPLEQQHGAAGEQVPIGHLEQALHTYGAIKHLLPKLRLSPEERAPVEELLQRLRAQIVTHGHHDGGAEPATPNRYMP